MATETIIDPTVAMPGATSSSPALIEFRCTRCWNSNLAECSASGTSIECRSCGHEVIVPEATPERIARAQSLNQELLPAPTIDLRKELNTVLSDHDLIRLANEELRVPLDQQDFSDFPPASLWARFFAQMIDTIVFMTVFSLGVFISSFLFGVTPKHVRSVNGINTRPYRLGNHCRAPHNSIRGTDGHDFLRGTDHWQETVDGKNCDHAW